MDLNKLLFRHQLSLMKADAAGTPQARYVHMDSAESYAVQIRDFQRRLSVASPLLPEA